MGKLVTFLNRQRIHVRAQADHLLAGAVADYANHAGLSHAAVHLDAPGGEFLRDNVAGAVFLETQLGVRVDIAADCLDFALKLHDAVDQVHGLQGEFDAGGTRSLRVATRPKAPPVIPATTTGESLRYGSKLSQFTLETTMPIAPRLANYLDEHLARYELCDHAHTETSAQTARSAHVPPQQLAKSVILEDDRGCGMAVLPADRRVHIGELARPLGRHGLHLM